MKVKRIKLLILCFTVAVCMLPIIQLQAASGISGDVDGNGSLQANDLTVVRKSLLGIINTYDDSVLDVNKDGVFNIKDLVALKKLIAQIGYSDDVLSVQSETVTDSTAIVTVKNTSTVWESSEQSYIIVSCYNENRQFVKTMNVDIGIIRAQETKTLQIAVSSEVYSVKVTNIVAEYWSTPVK